MDFNDETAPVYEPDFDLLSSDHEMFSDSSSSEFTMSTITSDEVAGYFESINGFLFSADENVPSIFPAHPDTIKIDLYTHTIVRSSFGGQNIPPEAARVLHACEATGGAKVLHLMTDSGIWVQQMAKEYPTATFLSIDTTPLVPHRPDPRITYEVYDVYAGIAEPDGSFDIVYATLCVPKTKDFNSLLREMHRVLKPDGMLLLVELPYQEFEFDCPLEPLHSSPGRTRVLHSICQVCERQGVDLTAWGDMSERLKPDHSLWNERSTNPAVSKIEPADASDSVQGFYSIVHHTRLVPIGPWPSVEAQRMLGLFVATMIMTAQSVVIPILLSAGMEHADALKLIGKALEECYDNSIRGCLKCHCWSARRLPLCP